jgi:proline iminopeptidase
MADRKRRGLPRLAYKLMWGPNEFVFVGTLRYWDMTGQLRLIGTPTLITCGKYDEVTPKNGEVLSQGIKDSKFTIFQKSSHCAYLEEPEKYLEVYKKFVDGLS